MFKFYEVGGCVRDALMGIESKDIDYVVVADDELLYKTTNPNEIFYVLKNFLEKKGYHIWLETEDCFTIRAKFPPDHKNEGLTADFVLARKEIGYYPNSRKPIVVAGTLFDDLRRRDFTVNAIAKDENDIIIDPFDGRNDIVKKILKTPLDCKVTFDDDPLRILRAIRFSITKKFEIPLDMIHIIREYDYTSKMGVVSEERIREELYKALKKDSHETIYLLTLFPSLLKYIFTNTKLWFKPTNEKQ